MNWPFFMHALGILCLAVMFAAAVYTIVTSIAPQWRRILSLALGNVEPAFEPLSPTASVASPPATRHPQLRAVEACAEPTLTVSR